ncbi:PKD domain-containing protein [Colwellia sp. MB3u-4]|uniref:PKD domain-containing protein n=1 Tax=Colwellia sp. MB3u-4 TaxID=2759822 RepID=UPI0015F3F58E|nr:S8 family serine peptidase [Colwellia sp. MB3u-4]MBA6288995.1 S8 family serine peptidase [Colwellia sp. MB3u-4]
MNHLSLKSISPFVLALIITACGGGGGSSSTPSTPEPVKNQSPSANAGANQIVNENTEVSLLGAGSDSDGTIASYIWTQSSGTDVILSTSDSASTSFITPEVTNNEVFTFTLTVTDNEGATETDTITINVNNVNILPSVDAGEDQSVYKNDVIMLSGIGSDTDGSIAQSNWIQTGGTSITLENSDTASASFIPSNLTADETLIFQLTVIDNDGGEAFDSVNITVFTDSIPELSADKILVEVEQSSRETISFTAIDDLMTEDDLYNSLTLECDRDPNESFDININYNQIRFRTMDSKPNYEEDCVVSVTDTIGQTASVTFTLKKLEDTPAEILSFDGPQILMSGQTVEVTVIGDGSKIELPLEITDSNFDPIEGMLTASYENNKITIIVASDAQTPDEGFVFYIVANTRSELGSRGRGNTHGIRLVKSTTPYDNLKVAFERAKNEFKHSQDYYHLKMFTLDYAQNNQLITVDEYEEQVAITYAPSAPYEFNQAERAINNLVNYLPSEVTDLAVKLNNVDPNFYEFDYFYWQTAEFIELYGKSNFPAPPEYNSKKLLSDNSYSNLIGDTAIGAYVDDVWTFNAGYEYLQAVVDMKYWLNVNDASQTSSAVTREMAMQLRDRAKEDKLKLGLANDAMQERLVYPLGFRSEKKITPPINVNKSSVMAQSSVDPIFNDPYFKDQLWMKNQPVYKGAQSLLKLKDTFTETRTSRIAVIDGNFIPTDEINFVEGFDAIEMDNEPFVTFEEAQAGDYAFHGMAVSSVIGAISNNNYGIAGVLANVEIVPIRVFENGRFGSSNDAANGIRWAAGYSFEGVQDISSPVDVINLSLGSGGECNSEYQTAIDYALAKGVIVVASSGNDSDKVANAPANCRGIVAVGANDINGNRADFSNYDINGIIDASAVGVEVPVLDIIIGDTAFEETISLWDGTSFSGPIVASVLALIKQNLEGFPTALAQQHIKNSSGNFNRECADCGPGVANSDAAVNSAIAQPVKVTAEIVNKYHDYTDGYKQGYLKAQIDNGADACTWWGVTLDNDIVFDDEYALKLSSASQGYALSGVDNQFNDGSLGDVTLELCSNSSCIATLETTNNLTKPGICQ